MRTVPRPVLDHGSGQAIRFSDRSPCTDGVALLVLNSPEFSGFGALWVLWGYARRVRDDCAQIRSAVARSKRKIVAFKPFAFNTLQTTA
jgi:hypothetical protein